MKKYAFSLVEMLISLIAISCIMVALTPIFTKHISKELTFSSSNKGSEQITTSCNTFGEKCMLCDSNKCILCNINCNPEGLKDTQTCSCKSCSDFDPNCSECNDTECTNCKENFYLNNKNCSLCPKGHSCNGKNTTICSKGTYAQSGDGVCSPCENGKISSEGASECSSCGNGKYSNPTHTVCQICEAGNKCVNGIKTPCSNEGNDKYQNLTQQNICKTCSTGNYVNLSRTECIPCPQGANCSNGGITGCKDGTYQQNGSSECIKCPENYYCKNGTKNKCQIGEYSEEGASECLKCIDKFNNCISCTKDECTSCNAPFKPDSTGKCINNPCPDKTIPVGNTCVMQYNIGDNGFPLPMTINSYYQTNCYKNQEKCCWQGTTTSSNQCSTVGGYSGCNRTVCNWYGAYEACSSLTYEGRTWRLPTEEELKSWINYSPKLGLNGLLLCDSTKVGMDSAWCLDTYQNPPRNGKCQGSYTGYCLPSFYWGKNTDPSGNSTSAYNYNLESGKWQGGSTDVYYTSSVRCVSDN